MTTLAESTKRKLSLLQLAEELKNVSKACQIMGYHRDKFYEVRRAFKVVGVGALVAQRRGPSQPPPKSGIGRGRGADPRLLPSSARQDVRRVWPTNCACKGSQGRS
jgi:hypothetical protein